MRLRLLLHGKIAQLPEIRDAVGRAREQGHTVEVRVTWESGDNERLVREAFRDGVETLVAGGGDGTIHEVVSAIFREGDSKADRPSLGVLPLGTANDFANSCHIPHNPTAALETVLANEPVPIDVARVDDRILVNVATGGFGSEVTVETSDMLKKVLGGAAYLVTGITKLGSFTLDEASFRGPDFEWSGSFPIVAVGNGRQAGGGHVLCPDAILNDGLLDVRILPTSTTENRVRALQDLIAEGEAAIEKAIVQARVPWLQIESREAIQINLDGEPVVERKFRFEVLPKSLRVHIPPEANLLAG